MICWFPELAEAILRSLYDQTRPSLEKFVEGAGHLPDWDVVLMQTAYCLAPEPLSPALLIERVPYTRPGSFLERMRAAARRGWLYEVDGKFGLTIGGLEVVEGVYELGDRLCAKIGVLGDLEMARLQSFLDAVIDEIKLLSEPGCKPAYKLSLRFDRGDCRPYIVQVRQKILIMLAFRDDAHVAAWRPHECNGQIWETFTLVWREQAGSATELVARLPHRNYAESDYLAALKILVARGWIKDRGDRFVVGEQAARMRQEVEAATDRMFIAAFNSLSPAAKCEFQELMEKLSRMVAPLLV